MDRTKLMHESLRLHFEEARARLKRVTWLALAVALTPALVIGICVGNVVSFVACALLFLILTAAMPLAVYFTDIRRVRALQLRVQGAAESVSSVVDSKIRFNSGRSRRAMVRLKNGDRFALILGDEQIHQLVAAFPPSDDFETLLARFPG